jgi:hypothetical protein
MPLRKRFRKLFSRHDDSPNLDGLTRQGDSQEQASVSKSSTTTTNIQVPISLPERLWDQAYDDLKIRDAALVQVYEKILSRKLGGQGFSSPVTESEQNIISQDDANTRRTQMRQLIHEGLNKTAQEAKIKEVIGTATQLLFSAKNTISSAIQAIPQAALAWTGVCVALEVIDI